MSENKQKILKTLYKILCRKIHRRKIFEIILMKLKCDIFHFSSTYAAISLFMIELNLLENILCKNEKR